MLLGFNEMLVYKYTKKIFKYVYPKYHQDSLHIKSLLIAATFDPSTITCKYGITYNYIIFAKSKNITPF